MVALMELAAVLDVEPTVVISGAASGADTLGEKWAMRHGIPVERFVAQWEKHGKSAGYKRNAEMVAVADAAVVLWDGESRGTRHTIGLAKEAGLRLVVAIVQEGKGA
jgi:hypothetical protein